MRYSFVPMTIDRIRQIADWKYDGVVKSVYIAPYLESHARGDQELRGPGDCHGYAVLDGDDLVGLFEYYFKAGIMEIGLALNPAVTGKGLGKDFVLAGLRFGMTEFGYNQAYVKLTVDVKNLPAVRVYEKAGFVRVKTDANEITMHWFL